MGGKGSGKSNGRIPTKAELKNRVKKGKTQEQIAKEFGITQGTVSQHMKKHGIKPNNYGSTGVRGGTNEAVYCNCGSNWGHLPNCAINQRHKR
jgi:hypothetical protein